MEISSMESTDGANRMRFTADKTNNATRWLAGAAYVDWKFRNSAIDADAEPNKAAAPELGIDPSFVLFHCRRAQTRNTIKNSLLLLILFFTVFSGLLIDSVNEYTSSGELDVPMLILVWLAASCIVFSEYFFSRVRVFTDELAPQGFERIEGDLGESGNVVVYGAFSPFVGSGNDLGGWSLAVNLQNAVEEKAIEDFSVYDLYAALSERINALEISGLSVKEYLFVDGQSIQNDKRFLPNKFGRPNAEVPQELINNFMLKPSRSIRYYLCFRVSDWSGEFVLSTFIRIGKTKSSLFCECSNFLLPPLKKNFYDIDRINHGSIRNIFRLIGQAFIVSPFFMFFSPITLWQDLAGRWKHSKQGRNRREISENPLFNYGATTSIRELGTSDTWRVYFQKLDQEMHRKTIYQQLLDCIVCFLDERGIDTSEIKDRRAHILNQGLIISGGQLNADSLAVGKGAQALFSGLKNVRTNTSEKG